jgi:signal transduction histidine kinase
LNNIAKYSRADRVGLSLLKSDRAIDLTIEDNGAGFDLGSVLSIESHRRGLGLTSM